MAKGEFKEKLKVNSKLRVLIVLIGTILITLMFPRGESLESDVEVGSIWIQDDLIASMPFEILKDPETYRIEKLRAAESVYQVFELDQTVKKSVLDSIEVFNDKLLTIIDEQLRSNFIDNKVTFLSEKSFEKLRNIRKYENSLSVTYNNSVNRIFTIVNKLVTDIYSRNFLDVNHDDIKKDSIAIRDGKYQNLIPKRRFLDKASNEARIDRLIENYLGKDLSIYPILKEYLDNFIEPTIKYNEAQTNEEIRIAEDKVSRNIGLVEENERIVAKHNRITPEIKLKIDSYRIAKGEEIGTWTKFLQGLGKFLHVLVLTGLFSIYIFLFRKNIFHDNSKIFLIAIIMVLISFIAFLINHINVTAPVQLLILVPVVSMLLTIFFDSRVGFYSTVVMALIVGGLRGNDYALSVMNLFAGALAAYTVRDIKNRNQIFRSFLFILLGYVVTIIAFGLERFASWEEILIECGFAASNALFSPVLTYGLIIFFEKIFKLTTEITLLELTDYNTPLLKELAKHAQGTFNHSLTMGNMVESAAEEIGANPLLVRVGALYHDIGKSQNPSAFVENQMDNYNLHDQLTAEESAITIIEHVPAGIRLAEGENIPSEIIDFISTHHGTLLVSYFYEKAVAEKGEENVNINNYRYPGPKPATKETALLMLADACESAVRAMTEPTPEKIENIVKNIINSRLKDGQLEESPLTFVDLKKIRQSFYTTLIALHHKRIRYPKQEELESVSKEDSSE
ncbi:MAG: HDIG domain-containing protein [Ignavibacteriae bacterium]|nr:HDIG domain-containing protein [Ignavibacteriota bacterium]MCB9210153.1 HDIG domain-containing protein [Ignavibacteriales bacterium]MCB9218462.1 HDIG domain-containing protein [Ignavibacteriales bacterium]MCB9259532.1 HDIG domain-containing protein [Ignavibacteriales bacterium]